MINRYRKYLSILDAKLEGMFERQKPFIKCKKGCVYCCSEGDYPMSELEFIDIMLAYQELNPELKLEVENNIKNLISKEKSTLYKCPFLINKACAVYSARALICRTFGLISYYKNERKKIPFCVDLGLNYAEVFNKNTGKIEAIAQDGTEPLAFNVSRNVLRSKETEKDFGIFFGEDKTLYDWLKEDFKKNN